MNTVRTEMKNIKKVLLVEDDASLGETLFQRLKKDFDVVWCRSEAEVYTWFKSQSWAFDLVLLDIGLPDGSGLNVASQLKQKMKTGEIVLTPFLFLTAQSDAETRLQAFELGAEEFIPKPFHLKELLLRMNHIFERHLSLDEKNKSFGQTEKNNWILDNCELDFVQMCVRFKEGRMEYPPLNDMKVLKLILESAPSPVSRDQIIDKIWGTDKDISHRYIDNLIVRLRDLLDDKGEKLRSVRGVGYQWVG